MTVQLTFHGPATLQMLYSAVSERCLSSKNPSRLRAELGCSGKMIQAKCLRVLASVASVLSVITIWGVAPAAAEPGLCGQNQLCFTLAAPNDSPSTKLSSEPTVRYTQRAGGGSAGLSPLDLSAAKRAFDLIRRGKADEAGA